MCDLVNKEQGQHCRHKKGLSPEWKLWCWGSDASGKSLSRTQGRQGLSLECVLLWLESEDLYLKCCTFLHVYGFSLSVSSGVW